MRDGIREADVQTDANGVIANVRLVFGPHHFVTGTTHHGFLADASIVDSELERIINEVREAHPDLTVDRPRRKEERQSWVK